MTIDIDDAINALLAYQQADMEGTMVLTSRQAIHEVANEIRRIRADAQQPFTSWGQFCSRCGGKDAHCYICGIRRVTIEECAKAVESDKVLGRAMGELAANVVRSLTAQEAPAVALAAQPPAAPVEPQRCAECSCEKGAEECNWIAPAQSSSAATEEERHAIAHARYQVEHATDAEPECCFDYQLVETLLRVIDRNASPQGAWWSPEELQRAKSALSNIAITHGYKLSDVELSEGVRAVARALAVSRPQHSSQNEGN